jgi:hypothetical protein
MPLRIQEYVLWLEVSVDDILLVEVFDCKAELGNVELGLILREGDLSSQMET